MTEFEHVKYDLEKKMMTRRSKQDLIENNILYSTKRECSFQNARKNLQRNITAAHINEFLTGRPSTDDLIRNRLFEDTMIWNREVINGPPPTPRNCHTATVIGKNMYVLGGFGGTDNLYTMPKLSELMVFDIENLFWSRPFVAGQLPCERYSHSCVAVGTNLVLFGGFSFDGSQLNDLYILDTAFEQKFVPSLNRTSNTNSTLVNEELTMLVQYQPQISGWQPLPRAATCAVVVDKRVYYFGGNDGMQFYNDLFVFDTETFSQIQLSSQCSGDIPSPRAGHTATLIEANLAQIMVVFGGNIDSGYSNETYFLNLQTLVWTRVEVNGTPPSPRAGHTTISILNNTALLVFGGGCENKVFGDLHMFDIATCKQTRPSDAGMLPQARGGHSCVSFNSIAYFFGGADGDSRVFNDVHSLDTAFLLLKSLPYNQSVGHRRSPSYSYSCRNGNDQHNSYPLFDSQMMPNAKCDTSYMMREQRHRRLSLSDLDWRRKQIDQLHAQYQFEQQQQLQSHFLQNLELADGQTGIYNACGRGTITASDRRSSCSSFSKFSESQQQNDELNISNVLSCDQPDDNVSSYYNGSISEYDTSQISPQSDNFFYMNITKKLTDIVREQKQMFEKERGHLQNIISNQQQRHNSLISRISNLERLVFEYNSLANYKRCGQLPSLPANISQYYSKQSPFLHTDNSTIAHLLSKMKLERRSTEPGSIASNFCQDKGNAPHRTNNLSYTNRNNSSCGTVSRYSSPSNSVEYDNPHINNIVNVTQQNISTQHLKSHPASIIQHFSNNMLNAHTNNTNQQVPAGVTSSIINSNNSILSPPFTNDGYPYRKSVQQAISLYESMLSRQTNSLQDITGRRNITIPFRSSHKNQPPVPSNSYGNKVSKHFHQNQLYYHQPSVVEKFTQKFESNNGNILYNKKKSKKRNRRRPNKPRSLNATCSNSNGNLSSDSVSNTVKDINNTSNNNSNKTDSNHT